MSSSQKDYSADKLNNDDGKDGASEQLADNQTQEVINASGGGMFEDQGQDEIELTQNDMT